MPIQYQNNIEIINKMCFDVAEYPSKRVDAILVFGSLGGINAMMNCLYDLLDKEISNKIIICGGINPRRKKPAIVNGCDVFTNSEAHIIYEGFNKNKYPDVEIILEDESTNTKENVEYALKHFVDDKSLCYLCKSHHAGRVYRTIKEYAHDINLYQATFNAVGKESDNLISKGNWSNNSDTLKEVLGEVERIYNYGHKGDIAFKDSDREDFKKLGF